MIIPFESAKELFTECEIELSQAQYDAFDKYAELLVDWNSKINLTAITDPQGITEKHFLDSVILLKYVKISDNNTLIDVGTGAGFPGIPLKIMKQNINVTLLDSLNKRVNFLNDVSEKLNLKMDCVHSRAEEAAKTEKYREKFDFSCARAVAPLPILCEYCIPYIKIGGKFCAMKGPNESEKTAYTAYKTLGAELSDVFEYKLPCGDGRKLFIFTKIKDTPNKYPRNFAQINKKNL